MVRAGAPLIVILAVGAALAADARAVVETFVARIHDVSIADLAVTEAFTLYHPDGRNVQTQGERRLFVKVPGRQRLEETIEGRREVRLVVDGRGWVRRFDGTVYEVPPAEAARARAHLLTPSRRGAADLLAEWRALGVRDDILHEEKFEGRAVVVLGARAGDRTSPAVWLDPERGVVRLIAREPVGGREGLIDRTYADHRPIVREVFYPYRQEMFLDGRLLTRITVRSVEINTGLADALFDPALLHEKGR